MKDRSFEERLLDIVDEINDCPLRTLTRRRELRVMLRSHGYDYSSTVGRWLIEELYHAIYYEE